MLPPDNPAGELDPPGPFDESVRLHHIESLLAAPARLEEAVRGLDDGQLDTKYRNWTIRQITHHLADSHIHSYIRFKWALTEEHPTIKAYEEADWVELADSRRGELEPSLSLFRGLHSKWAQLLRCMPAAQFQRTFLHPQSGQTVDLWTALNYYPWHARHHTSQILWLRNEHGW